ncbi:hypothetical protein TcasGA2_TC034662 [Tribolium castaneum]|uniref:C2H2-type domain-containing protein n=1 Tax=Tribolium castaneum TaxID=7070 RepID=A0A139WJD0_TRICA|nr:hypothetical protein TcasGA2_TC034662 [Tribolium castaneum]
MSGKDIKCCVCQKQFSAVFKLAKHARKYHPEQAADIIPKKSYKYQCLQYERNLLISEDPKASEVSGIVTGLTVNEALNPKEFDKQFIAKERQRLIETFIQLLEGATCMEQLEAAKNMCIALETTLPFNSNEKGANNTVYTCKS